MLERGLVEAVVEAHAAALVILLVLADGPVGGARRGLVGRRRDGHEQAAVIDRRDALDAALAVENHAHDLAAVRRPGARPEQDAELLHLAEGGDLGSADRRHDAPDLIRIGAVRTQHDLDRLTLADGNVALLEQRLGAARLDLGEAGDVLGDDAYLDRAEGRIERAARSQRVVHPGGLAEDARQHELRRHRHATPDIAGEPPLLLDLGEDVGIGERRPVDRHGEAREVALDHRDVGIGDRGGRFGEALALRFGEQAQRVERGNVGRVGAARQGQVGGDAHEGPHPNRLAVAVADRHRRPERLLGEGHHLRAHQLVALASEVQPALLAGHGARRARHGALGDRREGHLAVMRDEDRRADQGRAGDTGEHAGTEPAQAHPAAVHIGRASGRIKRRFVAEIKGVKAPLEAVDGLHLRTAGAGDVCAHR